MPKNQADILNGGQNTSKATICDVKRAGKSVRVTSWAGVYRGD